MKIMNVVSAKKVFRSLKKLQEFLLGYKYNYDRIKNEKIISKVYLKFKNIIEDDNEEIRLNARTIAHYEAHLGLRPLTSILFFEILSYFIFPLFILVNLIKGRLNKKNEKEQCDGIKCVFPERWKLNKELFVTPHLLIEKKIKTYPMTKSSLTLGDIKIIMILILRAAKYGNPYPIQLALKCAMDLSKLRQAIKYNNPRFILVYWEFSCSLSFLTYALHKNNIRVYNIMHGDKHYYAKHSFFEVDKCFCWNKYYIGIFKDVHARSEFIQFENPAYRITPKEEIWLNEHTSDKIGIVAPHTSTLTDNSKELSNYILKFSRVINKLARENKVIIRTHPHYKDDFNVFLRYLSEDVVIENPSERESRFFILESRIIIGTVSSILIEAAHLNKHVITIDTPAIEAVKNYHYMYNLPNVHNIHLENLYEKIYSL